MAHSEHSAGTGDSTAERTVPRGPVDGSGPHSRQRANTGERRLRPGATGERRVRPDGTGERRVRPDGTGERRVRPGDRSGEFRITDASREHLRHAATAVETDHVVPTREGPLGDTVLGQPLVRAVVVGLATFGLWVLFGAIGSALLGPGRPQHYGVPLLQAVGALIGYAVLTGLIEGRLPGELSPWPGLFELLAGILGGAVVVMLAGIALWLGNWIAPRAAAETKLLSSATAMGLLTAAVGAVGWIVLQELLLRAVLARVLELYLGSVFTILAMCVGFAVAFAFVPRVGPFAVLAVALWGGVMQTVAWMRTRRVWLPIGLRLGWYAMLSGVLGAASWRHPPTRSVLRTESLGPEWLTGGAAGLVGSMLLGGAALFVGLTLLASAREHRLLGSAHTMRHREGLD